VGVLECGIRGCIGTAVVGVALVDWMEVEVNFCLVVASDSGCLRAFLSFVLTQNVVAVCEFFFT